MPHSSERSTSSTKCTRSDVLNTTSTGEAVCTMRVQSYWLLHCSKCKNGALRDERAPCAIALRTVELHSESSMYSDEQHLHEWQCIASRCQATCSMVLAATAEKTLRGSSLASAKGRGTNASTVLA
jgi:hypothetical protein